MQLKELLKQANAPGLELGRLVLGGLGSEEVWLSEKDSTDAIFS